MPSEAGDDKGGEQSAKPTKTTDEFLDPTSKTVDREKLSSSVNIVELNRVTSSRYTKKSQRVSLLNEKGRGGSYICKNINKPGALFFIKLAHYEGELRVGLARRTFDSEKDKPELESYAVEWFERKNKREASWGKKPGFRQAIVGYDPKRKPIISTSIEALEDFLPIEVQVNKGKANVANENEPSLSQDCMDSLRMHMNGVPSTDEEEEVESGEEEESGSERESCTSSDEESDEESADNKRKRKVSTKKDH